jgi:hypothetical protein
MIGSIYKAGLFIYFYQAVNDTYFRRNLDKRRYVSAVELLKRFHLKCIVEYKSLIWIEMKNFAFWGY